MMAEAVDDPRGQGQSSDPDGSWRSAHDASDGLVRVTVDLGQRLVHTIFVVSE
jgi:hypothetical protein